MKWEPGAWSTGGQILKWRQASHIVHCSMAGASIVEEARFLTRVCAEVGCIIVN